MTLNNAQAVSGAADAAQARRTRGRPRAASDETRRKAIVDCALSTFLELGYAETTTSRVAQRCRISKATLYRLFPSKTELFIALVIAHRQTMLALPRPDDDAPLAEAIAEIFRIDIDAQAERERAAFIQLALHESASNPEVGQILSRYGALEARLLLAQWLARQRERGAIVLDDVESGARMLMDMIFGAMVARPPGFPSWPDGETRHRHIRRCIEIFLNGAVPRATVPPLPG